TYGEESVRAFVPPPLPPNPPVRLEALQRLLEQANQSLGRLDGLASVLPNLPLFTYAYVRKEAVLSSQIEGTQSSLSDLLLFENGEVPGVPLNDVQEVSNYVAALNHGLERLRGGFPLSLRLIREIHEVLLSKGRGSDKQPGEFRESQNWIGGPGDCGLRSAATRTRPRLHERPRTIPARRASGPAVACQGRFGSRPVRDNSPVPRRQRPPGAVAHHISAVRRRRVARTNPLPEPLFQAAPALLLRLVGPSAGEGRVGDLAGILPDRRQGHRRTGSDRSAPHPHGFRGSPPQDRGVGPSGGIGAARLRTYAAQSDRFDSGRCHKHRPLGADRG